MEETKKINALSKYKNVLGEAKETIDAIQKYIGNNSKPSENRIDEEDPVASINRVLKSNICEETAKDIQKIIDNI